DGCRGARPAPRTHASAGDERAALSVAADVVVRLVGKPGGRGRVGNAAAGRGDGGVLGGNHPGVDPLRFVVDVAGGHAANRATRTCPAGAGRGTGIGLGTSVSEDHVMRGGGEGQGRKSELIDGDAVLCSRARRAGPQANLVGAGRGKHVLVAV